MTKKRVLVFAEYIGENHNSTAYYWSQIIKHLSDTYEVILVAPENRHSVEFIEKYAISAYLVKHAKHNKNSLLSRLYGQIHQSARLMAVIRRELKRSDLVFSGTNPILAMGAMSVLYKLHKCKWLVLVHDVFPNNLVPARIITIWRNGLPNFHAIFSFFVFYSHPFDQHWTGYAVAVG